MLLDELAIVAHRVFYKPVAAFAQLDGLKDDARRRHRSAAVERLGRAAAQVDLELP